MQEDCKTKPIWAACLRPYHQSRGEEEKEVREEKEGRNKETNIFALFSSSMI